MWDSAVGTPWHPESEPLGPLGGRVLQLQGAVLTLGWGAQHRPRPHAGSWHRQVGAVGTCVCMEGSPI